MLTWPDPKPPNPNRNNLWRFECIVPIVGYVYIDNYPFNHILKIEPRLSDGLGSLATEAGTLARLKIETKGIKLAKILFDFQWDKTTSSTKEAKLWV
jgi:hypothetical protein